MTPELLGINLSFVHFDRSLENRRATKSGVVDVVTARLRASKQTESLLASASGQLVQNNRTVVAAPTTMMSARTILGDTRRTSIVPSHPPMRAPIKST